MNIYVGNLPYRISEDDLRQAFEAFGQVSGVTIIKDKFSGKSRGFGFVEMPDDSDARSAITGMNGKELQGRALSVNEARPKSEDGDRGDRGDRRDRGDRGDRGDRDRRGGGGRRRPQSSY